jgi:CTP-dependent riboflavin kinase
MGILSNWIGDKLTTRRLILKILGGKGSEAEAPVIMSVEELANETNRSKPLVRRLLNRMRDKGDVKRIEEPGHAYAGKKFYWMINPKRWKKLKDAGFFD